MTKICIEIENNFKGILIANNYAKDPKKYTIEDYFQLNKFMRLNEYVIKSSDYDLISTYAPFASWAGTAYTPLLWYQAYNEVKHNRDISLEKANLKNVLDALGGLYILLYAQFNIYAEYISNVGMLTFVYGENESVTLCNTRMGYYTQAKPMWNDIEKYDFDWGVLQNDPNPFDCVIF